MKVVGASVVLFSLWGGVWGYTPSHFDTRLQDYIQEDIVDTHWEIWTDAEKELLEEKITKTSNEVTNERRTWHLEKLQLYWKQMQEQPAIIDVSWVEVVEDGAGALNMRSGPATTFDVVGKLEEGSVVKVTLEMEGWYEIDTIVQGKRVRIDARYVESVGAQDVASVQDNEEGTPDIPSVQEVIKRVEISPNDVGYLSIRSGAGRDYSVIGKMNVGEQADIVEEKNAYFRMQTGGWIAVDYVHLAGTEAPLHHLTRPTTQLLSSGDQKKKQAFLDEYRHLVDSKERPLIDLCKTYYDQIDAIARKYDFPVELIIATWYREHTCKFKNPANGRGNFQIISRYYAPGEISRSQFEQQVIDFINFSYGKWDYYDKTQNFGPAPISLSYDTFDLLSIRKHAIYYNGIVGTPENNKYANQNFNGISTGGADGIVASFLKILKYGLEK